MRQEDSDEQAQVAQEFYSAADGTPCDKETGEVISPDPEEKTAPTPTEDEARVARVKALFGRTKAELAMNKPEFAEFIAQWGLTDTAQLTTLTTPQLDIWEEWFVGVKDGFVKKEDILKQIRQAKAPAPAEEPMDADFEMQAAPEAATTPPPAAPATVTNIAGRRKAPAGI